MSSTYSEKLKDPRWQRKRTEVLNRDDFTCRDCGDKTKTVHVHHCHYEKGEPWEIDSRLLLTLCESCHDSRGWLERDGKRAVAFIFAQLSNKPETEEAPSPLSRFIQELVWTTEGHPVSLKIVEEYELDKFVSAFRAESATRGEKP